MLSEKKKNRCAADSGSSSYSVFRTAKQILPMQRQSMHFLPRITASVLQMGTVTVPQSPKPLPVHSYHLAAQGKPQSRPARQAVIVNLRQHRTIPALRLKHRSGSCGTASALQKCSIMSGCGTRIVLRGQKPLALCDRCPCFGSLFPPLAALTFAASSIICAFGLAAAVPRSPYRHLELCGIAILFLQTQRDFALKTLGIHKEFLRLFALNPVCVCEISVIFFVFRYTLKRGIFPRCT